MRQEYPFEANLHFTVGHHMYMCVHVYHSSAHKCVYMHEHMSTCVITFAMAQGWPLNYEGGLLPKGRANALNNSPGQSPCQDHPGPTQNAGPCQHKEQRCQVHSRHGGKH